MIYIPTSEINYEIMIWSGSRIPDYAEAILLQEKLDKHEGKEYYQKTFYTYEELLAKYFNGKEIL